MVNFRENGLMSEGRGLTLSTSTVSLSMEANTFEAMFPNFAGSLFLGSDSNSMSCSVVRGLEGPFTCMYVIHLTRVNDFWIIIDIPNL